MYLKIWFVVTVCRGRSMLVQVDEQAMQEVD